MALSNAEYNQVNVFTKEQYWFGDDPDVDEAWADCGIAQFVCGSSIMLGQPVVAFVTCMYGLYKCTRATRKALDFQEKKRLEELEKAEKEKANGPGAGGGGESGNGGGATIHPPSGSTGTGGTGNHGAGSGKKPVVTIIDNLK